MTFVIADEADLASVGDMVLDLVDVSSSDDLPAVERAYVTQYRPKYVVAKVRATDVAAVHGLESAGFRLLEWQYRLTMVLDRDYDVGTQPYRLERVDSEAVLQEVLDLAAGSFTHDRYSIDPAMGPAIAAERYRRYLRRSFASSDEFVHRLVSVTSGEVVAFKTHRRLDENHALLLLDAVKPAWQGLGIGKLNQYFACNELRKLGFRRLTTHVSARNLPMLNLEIGRLGFRIDGASVVLRKCYW